MDRNIFNNDSNNDFFKFLNTLKNNKLMQKNTTSHKLQIASLQLFFKMFFFFFSKSELQIFFSKSEFFKKLLQRKKSENMS